MDLRYPVMEYVKLANTIVINKLPFLTNENLYSDLHIKWIDEIFHEFSVQKYKAAVYKDVNEVFQMLNNNNKLGTSPAAQV